MHCPLCHCKDVGRVGTDQYYCWNCLVEFSLKGKDGPTAYYVDEEGTLISLSEMVQNSQMQQESILG